MTNSIENAEFVCKIVIIGDSGVGKTSVMRRFADDDFLPNFAPTIGVDFKAKQLMIKKKLVKVQIWDTANLDKYQSMTSSYYRDARAVIIAYDITNRKSFESVNYWISDFKRHSDESLDVEQVLIGNKSDIEDCRVVTMSEGEKLAESNGMEFSETSAKDDVNVNKIFMELLEVVVTKELIQTEEGRRRSEHIILSSYNQKRTAISKAKCC